MHAYRINKIKWENQSNSNKLIEISFKNLNFVLLLSTKFKESLFNKNGSIKASFNKKIFWSLAIKDLINVQSEIHII